MRGWIVAPVAALIVGLMAAPAHAEPGGRGNDGGDADRPHQAGPESAMSDYKAAKWLSASKSNYTNADRPKSESINKVVVHTTQGSYEGTKSWFRNSKSEVSTHYVIRSSDGEITQMVHEEDIAWHAGNWDVNKHSIGIEHEGYVDKPSKWYTKQMYESSAKLVRSICDRYDIPMDRKHIVGHSEVPKATHTDPGKGWDWDKYMDLIRDGDSDGDEPITLDNDMSTRVQASSSWKTTHLKGDYDADYAYATPVSKSDPLWYKAAIPRTGKYRVEIWYPSGPTFNDRAPYIVRDTGGNRAVYVDQRTGGGAWHSIGTFNLKSGDYPAVAVSRWTSGSGRIAADAVRLIKQ
jgi:N-acetyl-anhydromuramyl-L-alanine amidase AmpD